MGEKIVITGSSGDLSALAKKFKNEQFEIIGLIIKKASLQRCWI